MNPLSAVEYHVYLRRLLGDREPLSNAVAPIIGIIDAIFLLAMQRRTEEMRFEVRDDDSLDIRMRTEDTWTELLPLVCTGSALSRLFVIGHLEKGADARSKPQASSATILGLPMVFETEPVRRWREHVRVRVIRREGLSMNRVVLYSLMTDKIKITIQAYFDEDGNLIIDGHDIGTIVEDIFGDSDYEYTTTVHRDDVEKLNVAFGLPIGSREEMLLFLKTHYNSNACYSQIQSYLTQHAIPFDKFSWM